MNFSEALEFMKQGKILTRKNWINKYIYFADDGIIYCVNKDFEIWCDTHEDLLAEDWYVYCRDVKMSNTTIKQEQEEFFGFMNQQFEKQKDLFSKKNQQYSTDDALADFKTFARAMYGSESYFAQYKVALGYMGKHIAHVLNQNIDGDKVEESLKDISLYCLIMCYMIYKNKQTK